MAFTINNDLRNNIASRSLRFPGSTGSGDTGALFSGSSSGDYFHIGWYGGTRPATILDFRNNWHGGLVYRTSALVKWVAPVSARYTDTSVTDTTITLDNAGWPQKEATNAGTVTWLAMVRHLNSTPYTPYQIILGDVGLAGSGADFEISSTTVTTGDSSEYGFAADMTIDFGDFV